MGRPGADLLDVRPDLDRFMRAGRSVAGLGAHATELAGIVAAPAEGARAERYAAGELITGHDQLEPERVERHAGRRGGVDHAERETELAVGVAAPAIEFLLRGAVVGVAEPAGVRAAGRDVGPCARRDDEEDERVGEAAARDLDPLLATGRGAVVRRHDPHRVAAHTEVLDEEVAAVVEERPGERLSGQGDAVRVDRAHVDLRGVGVGREQHRRVGRRDDRGDRSAGDRERDGHGHRVLESSHQGAHRGHTVGHRREETRRGHGHDLEAVARPVDRRARDLVAA